MSTQTLAATQTPQDSSASIVGIEVRPDGIAVITLDAPGESVNTLTERFGTELKAAFDLVTQDANVTAAVLTSGKKDFVVGANIDMLKSITLAADAERLSREGALSFRAIKASKKPFVAAVHGQALGGGFELALACHAIVASDDKKTLFGLPEVQLGLLPGANGLMRVAERAGLQVALDLGLTGKNTRAAKAKKLGLVDEVAPASILLEVAVKVAKELAEGKPRARPGFKFDGPHLTQLALEKNPAGRALLFRKAREATRKKTRGHYPATERILDVLERYGDKGFDAAAELEARVFGELVVSETAHRLEDIFFATTALKKDSGVDDPQVKGQVPSKIGMLGGGLMGGGIAYVSLNAGVHVRLKDKDDEGIGRGLQYVRGILDERVKKRQLSREERDQLFARLTATTDYSGLRDAGIVIEAVFEDLALKHRILREVEAVTKEDTIFASNTSSIPIGKIAEASKRPHTVVGMHYFSPVHKMPLLEVIRTKATSPQVVASAVALGKKQGKTVIVVNDGVGFYTSRILAPYMNEAAYLLSEGVPIETLDRALVDWGWPVGPVTLLDEVGIDVAAHVGPIMLDAFGERFTPPDTMSKLVADDRKGRKNERGFYLYGKNAKGKKKAVDPSVYTTLGIEPKTGAPVLAEELQMRCSLQFVNEALRCYGEGILRTPRDGDIGAIFGLGFPPFRGGPFRYVDTIGAAEILRRTQGYYDRFGKRWEPAPLLVEMAKKGARFY
ncbi:fatty acid oxidation complex subunit alpha FadJ [Pendulispora rubella]|uniref:enoyl-CoA hydratase n=1 Tax=Pendulispora rubella TaxID=2741070 RepID=A0ABZ2KZU3_9BACT